MESITIKSIVGNHRMFNVVVPTYNGGYKLEVFINCFLAQTCDDWQLTIISDGKEEHTEKIIEKYNHDNISYHHMVKRHNDWGHTPRECGIYKSNSLWTIMSGFDNYYVPTFIEEFKNASLQFNDCDFIFCNFVLNHIRNNIPYNGYMDSKLEVNYIDIGNFATKTSLLKEVGFPFRNYAADWSLVEVLINTIRQRETKIVKIPQTLYVHN